MEYIYVSIYDATLKKRREKKDPESSTEIKSVQSLLGLV